MEVRSREEEEEALKDRGEGKWLAELSRPGTRILMQPALTDYRPARERAETAPILDPNINAQNITG